MSNINVNTPATIPATIRSQSLGVAGEPAQSVVSKVRTAEEVMTSTVNATNATKESAKHQLTTESVKAAAEVGDKMLKAINKDLQFQVDDATKRVVVKIINSQTGEVIRQIPSVEMLDFIRVMKEQEANTGKILREEA
jgi:flagellar protein FlaG